MFLKIAIPLYPLVVEMCSFEHRTLNPTRHCMYPGSAAEIMGKFLHDLNISAQPSWLLGSEEEPIYTGFGRKLHNGSYSGLFGKLQDNLYDVLAYEVLINPERTDHFSLAYPISYPDSYYYYNKLYNTDTASSVYQVFLPLVWLGILISLLVLSLCFALAYGLASDRTFGHSLWSGMWAVLSLLGAQAQAIHSRYSKASMRSILATYAILLVIFTPLYQSRLLMRLLITSERATFQGTTSLAALVAAKQRLVMLAEQHGYEEFIYKNQDLEPCRQMVAAFKRNPPIKISEFKAVESVLQQNPTGVIGLFEKRLVLLGLGRYCNTQAAIQLDHDIKLPGKTFAFTKGHSAVKIFNQWVSRNSHFLQYINEKYDFLAERQMRQLQARPSCTSPPKTAARLSTGRLFGAWLFLLMGLVIYSHFSAYS